MNALVVLSAFLACAYAAPSVGYVAPALAAPLTYSAPLVKTIAAPAIAAPLAYSAPAIAAPVAYSAPAVAISKTVHYANQPVVSGYTSQIIKPNLGALATPLATVSKTPVIAPARSVATIQEHITQVQPVPVVKPVEVEVRAAPVVAAAPVAYSAPAIAPTLTARVDYAAPVVKTVAAPALATPIAYSAPALVAKTYAAPAIVAKTYAAPAFAHSAYLGAPAVYY